MSNAKCFLLNYPNTVVWVMSYVFKHIFLSIVLFNLIIIFFFPFVGLTFLVIYMI